MPNKITYKDSGVDIEAGYEAVNLMKKHITKTLTNNVISNIGGFNGLFSINKDDYDEPILVSSTDGVGTKLKIAFITNKHNTIGEDCVAMCVNDILCQGAKPLFFLDYIATGKIIPEKIASIVEGIANGCLKANISLIGGETAEMPDLYNDNEYDIAGFAVGIIDKKNIINTNKIKDDNILIGLASNGLHSNGFSLVRKVLFELKGLNVDTYIDTLNCTLGEELLKPSTIYVNPILDLIDNFQINGISHITGGGFYENIPRMLPKGLMAEINIKIIERHSIFDLIKDYANISEDEMYRTFNMGIGLIMAVNKEDVDNKMDFLKEKEIKAYVIGKIGKIKIGEDNIKLIK